MSSHLYHQLFKPRGLYAPEGRQCAGEDVLCSDRVGVSLVVAADTQKILSTAIQLTTPSTHGARPRSVGRIDSNKPNTVRLSLIFDPVEYSSVEPGCNGSFITAA